jgi:hypothetical protein
MIDRTTVKIWDAAKGQESLTLKGHTSRVTSVAFSPDGKRLASASYDQTVKVWDARPWTPELRVEQQALGLVRFYSTPPISKDELLDRIRADATVSEPVRERALEFARQWPEVMSKQCSGRKAWYNRYYESQDARGCNWLNILFDHEYVWVCERGSVEVR